ncbi:MAG: DUF1385 domain-containing protein [Clostridia bacterium]|nr:DUF1385 domain-containing protein [Clostridia bacterium]
MSKKEKNPRLGRVGGQAVLEGVMMRSGDDISIAVRREDGEIVSKNSKFTSVRKKHKFLNIPILRGCVNFVEMMKMSFSTMKDSTKLLGLTEFDEETKFDRWLKRKFGDRIMNVIMAIATVLGVLIAIGLFTVLPMLITTWIKGLVGGDETKWSYNFLFSLISGVIRIIIFIVYMILVSLMKDIKRTFEYHGAEHKSIACYESGMELTPANAKKCTRFHPRCGTSFIFVILILSILIFSLVPWKTDTFTDKLVMLLLRFALLPVVTGIGYEFLMYAGKHPNKCSLALSFPGLLMQRITTKEPDEEQLEVAIKALKLAMPEEFPEEAALEVERLAKIAEEDAKKKAETEAETASDGETDEVIAEEPAKAEPEEADKTEETAEEAEKPSDTDAE